jgi:hypothetical protein
MHKWLMTTSPAKAMGEALQQSRWASVRREPGGPPHQVPDFIFGLILATG